MTDDPVKVLLEAARRNRAGCTRALRILVETMRAIPHEALAAVEEALGK